MSLTLVALCAACLCVLFARPVHAFAPMCDQSATTVIAPQVAPPEQSGEILPCPVSLDHRDFSRPLLDGDPSLPGDNNAPLAEANVSARHCVSGTLDVPRRFDSSEVFEHTRVHGSERPGYARALDRPPC